MVATFVQDIPEVEFDMTDTAGSVMHYLWMVPFGLLGMQLAKHVLSAKILSPATTLYDNNLLKAT